MKKETKEQFEKDNKSYLESNPATQRAKAQKVLKRAKEQDAEKLAAGKKFVKLNPRTRVLR